MSKRTLLFVAIGAGVLIGLFYFTNSSKPGSPLLPQEDQFPQKVFELSVVGSKVSGEKSLKATVGERVTIRVTSDKSDELHVHGYELQAPLSAGSQGEVSFIADKTGRFPIELHTLDVEIAALEVFPK